MKLLPLTLSVLALSVLGSLVFASSGAAQGFEIRVLRGGGWERGPVDALLGQEVTLSVTRGGRPLPPEATVAWRRVVPHLQHPVGHAAGASVDDPTYSNAILGGPRHGTWVGLDTVEYTSVPFDPSQASARGATLVLRGASGAGVGSVPPRRSDAAGTLWVSASVVLDGVKHELPGEEDRDRLGLDSTVMRVSFRESDDFVGWLSAYFGVPYVFGSTPRQSERRVGIDCADVLVGARRLETGETIAYTSVQGVGRHAESVGETFLVEADGSIRDEQGQPLILRWGVDVAPGDLLAIDYSGSDEVLPRPWDHIGALLEDRGEAGVLDGADLLRHMGRRGLTDGPLTDHGPIRGRLWRWR